MWTILGTNGDGNLLPAEGNKFRDIWKQVPVYKLRGLSSSRFEKKPEVYQYCLVDILSGIGLLAVLPKLNLFNPERGDKQALKIKVHCHEILTPIFYKILTHLAPYFKDTGIFDIFNKKLRGVRLGDQ